MSAVELYANCAQDDGEIYANDTVTQPTVTNGVADANCVQDDDGEIYANDVVTPPTDAVTNSVAGTNDGVDDDQGEMEEEYENVIQINRPAEQQRSTSSDDEDRHIYQNVSRKPTPAPKPTRRF